MTCARPLRIVHTESSKGWGGQEIRVFEEMKAMRQRGHEVGLAAQADSKIYETARKADFDVFCISEKALHFPAGIAGLCLWLLKRRVQVVNTHSSKDGWIGGVAARLAGVPCLIRSRHIDVDYPRHFWSRMAFHVMPHHVTTTSSLIRSKLMAQMGLAAERIDTVPTGIDPQLFKPDRRDALRRELHLDPDAPLIGMISVIRSWKGHDYFIQAASKASAAVPGLRFVIAGGGPGSRYMPDWIAAAGMENRIHYLGYREDVASLLNSLDGLVLPSTAHEGIPQIILQAHLCACPVIGTTVGGIPEVVEEGRTGRLVPPRDADALAAAMIELVKDPAGSRLMAEEGRSGALKKHTLEVMCEQLEQIYKIHVP